MTDLFEYSTYVKASETIDRDVAIKRTQARAADSGWKVERIVSCRDVITYAETPVGFEVTLLVHRER